MEARDISKYYEDEFAVAYKYYEMLFRLSSLNLSETELNLIAFSAVRGTLSTPPLRDEFLTRFNVHKGTMYNILSKLQKLHIIIKEGNKRYGKYRINPKLTLNFSEPITFSIKLAVE